MHDILTSQLDYIFFFYGLAFEIMALSCFAMGRSERVRLGWDWLGMFGLAHGFNEWLDMGAYSLGDSLGFAYVRTLILMFSFLFLIEFGLSAGRVAFKRTPGRWVYAPLLALTLAGAAFGVEGLNAASRYALGFVGGGFAAASLIAVSARRDEPNRRWLGLVGVTLGMYALTTGLIVPEAGFFPASSINHGAFIELTGIPIQLVRGCLAVLAAVFATMYSRERRGFEASLEPYGIKPVYTFGPMLFVFLLVVAGWFMTEAIGDADKNEFRQAHIKWTKTLAGSFEPYLLTAIERSDGVLGPDDYRHLSMHLRRITSEIPDCRYVSVRKLAGSGMVVVADGEKEGSPGRVPPGTVLAGLTPEDVEHYEDARTVSREPEGGGVFEVVTPMFPEGGGKAVAQLYVSFDASQTIRMAALDRFYSIVIIGALCGLGIVLFIAWSRTRESITQAAELRLALLELGKEARLRDIAAALGEGLIVTDEAGLVTFMNPEAERLLGYGEEELKGKDAHDILHFQDASGNPTVRSECPTLIAIKTRTTRKTEGEHFTRKDMTVFPVDYVSAPLIEDGEVKGAVIVFRDVTNARRAMDALKMSEHSYRTLAGNLPGMVYRLILGDRNEMLFFNEMCLPMTGYSVDELSKGGFCSIEDLIYAGDRPRVLNEVSQAIMEDRPFQVEYRIEHRDGMVRHFLERGRPVRDEDGEPGFIDGVILDVTDEKLAEEELHKYRHIVEETNEEIYLIDAHGRYRYSNRAASQSLGYTTEELAGMKLSDVDPDYEEDAYREHFDELRKKGSMRLETTHVTKDGRRVPKDVNSSYLTIGGEGFICGVVKDISARKELERQRSDFFSMVTHDLKSPLSVIMTYADIMLNDYGPMMEEDLLLATKAIKSSSNKLLAMVEDFMAVSRLESGLASPKLTSYSIAEIVYEAGAAAKPLAAKKGIVLKVEGLTTSSQVLIDRDLVSRAVANLVQNAINFTPDGGRITLNVRDVEAEGRQYAAVSVTDTGPGIPQDEREKVFEKYYRSPSAAGTRGSGLGLTIVKEVAEAHGGYVRLDSVVGEGSTFTLLLPVRT